jgi:hypothetical protein
MTSTWAVAFLASIFLRAAGIIHPDSFHIQHFLVWFLVFAPSFCLLIYFLVKRYFFLNPSI